MNETEAVADSVINVLEDTYNIATETATTVERQGRQIERIGDIIDDADSEAERAKRILTRIQRKVMTDKYLLCLISMIVFAVIIIVILFIAGKGKIKSSTLSLN